tara:strand:- start:31367 stop:31792 length:426 start_codon:yes stop_codon:yes gene_type:complete
MKTLILIPFLFMLASCGTFSNLSEAIGKGKEIVTEIQDVYADLKPIADDLIESGKGIAGDIQDSMELYESLKDEMGDLGDELKDLNKEAFAKADKDGDGELDWMERLAYLMLLGGGGAEMARRKLKKLKEDREAAAAGEAS